MNIRKAALPTSRPMPLPIHPVEPADYEQIVQVWLESGLQVKQHGRGSKEAFERQLAAFPDLYLAARDADRIVGVVFGTHDQRKGWINRLAVLPAYRWRGVAKALVCAAEEAIRGHDIEILATLVEPDNAASLGLFRALGYRTDVAVVYFRKPSSPET